MTEYPPSSHNLAQLHPGREMRALVAREPGCPEVLEVVTQPVPTPMNSETLVRVLAAGVNPVDAKTRAGKGMAPAVPSWPWVPGGEFAGVVLEAPYELAPFQPGDEVFGMVLAPRYPGANAEVVTVPFLSLAPKPSNLSMVEAGGVPLAALTAWAAVVEAARVRSGMRMLIHAGAGGVGHFAVQLARIYGAEVVTTASARNTEFCRHLGASQVIDYTATRFEDELGEPVDVVVDLIGNVHDETGSRSIACLRAGGLFISVPTGSFPSMHEELAAANRGLTGTRLKCSPDGRALETIGQLIEQGDLRVHVDEVFPLDRGAEAHRRVEAGHVRGKVVLDLAG